MIRIGLVLLLALPLAAAADERILDFDSDIVVNADGSIEVTETIAVRAENARIRHGIYRDFPTEYRDRYGNRVVVRYEPVTVLRNDAREDYFTERRSNGIRAYFGSRDRLVEPGVHTYVYRYRASRVLGFFDEHDELYWNVTGLEWAFPIDRASATIRLGFDDSPVILDADAFTGPMGSTGRDFTSFVDGATVTFATTRALMPHDGLTIVATWPKGHVEEPGDLQRLVWLLRDNVNLLIALAGLIAVLGYFIPVWRRFGRDPDEGLIFPRYEPPAGYSPASLRYVRQMYYDNKVMTAAVVNLAVKGYLEIQHDGPKYMLKRSDPGDDAAPLAPGERQLLAGLFNLGSKVFLDQEYQEDLNAARQTHKRSLARDYAGHYFRTNGLLTVPGLLIGILAAVFALRTGPGPTPAVIAVVVLTAIAVFGFAAIMKRPTGRGRRLLDEVLGFKDYLEIAEKDELDLRNPPEKTPQLFETYLPFALALGVEQRWAEKFANVFAGLRGEDGNAYQPSWYDGRFNMARFGASTSGLMSNIDGAISSSVTPPGSSSGGGGGGSSGGGGGGGGGGGW